MTPEGKVKAKVNKLLAKYGDKVYRFMPVQMGMGAPSLDFLLCAAGQFIAVETKVPGKQLTPRQHQTRMAMMLAGGTVFVVYDEATLLLLKDYLDRLIA